jgi:predicted nucleic acid-binding protein
MTIKLPTNCAMNKQTIVGDSSPLIALAIVGQLDLLPRLFQRVIVPPAVWEEVTVSGSDLPGALEVSRATWLEIQDPPPAMLQSLMILLGNGEAQAITLALSIPRSTVLLDDAQARRVAERFGVARIGTLGILRRAKRAGMIGAIKPLLAQLQANGIHIRQNLIDSVLRDVAE